MKEYSKHSEWNFKNKALLIEAEFHNANKDVDEAASFYEASIKAAQEHKFIQEQAIANELAGIFFIQQGNYLKSYSFFMQSIECYEKWGANAPARRIKDLIQTEFESKLMYFSSIDIPSMPHVASASKETCSSKCQIKDADGIQETKSKSNLITPSIPFAASASKEPSSKKRQLND